MYYLKMTIYQRSAVGIILDGIDQAKERHAPIEVIRNLEEALISETLTLLGVNQQPDQN